MPARAALWGPATDMGGAWVDDLVLRPRCARDLPGRLGGCEPGHRARQEDSQRRQEFLRTGIRHGGHVHLHHHRRVTIGMASRPLGVCRLARMIRRAHRARRRARRRRPGLALVPAGADAASGSGPCCATCCSSATTGTAPPTWSSRARSGALARINIIPDIDERMREIAVEPGAARLLPRDPPGRSARATTSSSTTCSRRTTAGVLYVSRPSLADVVAINLRTQKIIWRTKVDGQPRRPHGDLARRQARARVGVDRPRSSTSSTRRPAQIVARIPSGDQPHENNFSKDGKLVYHASIGSVYTPQRRPASTPPRASASSRSSTRATGRSSRRSTWARSSTSSASRT